MQLKRILVAIKPWQRGLPLAANHARQLAKHANAELLVVGTVFDAAAAAAIERAEPAALGARARALAAARVDLERLAFCLRDWGANVTTRVVWGAPAYEAILAAAREWRADLVVVGAHEQETLHGRLTDTDWQLMRRATHPLLLVKSWSFAGYRTVIAAVDALHSHDDAYGSDRAVLDAGHSIACACGSTLRAVCAYAGAEAFALTSAVHASAVAELAQEFGIAATQMDLVAATAPDAIVDTVANRSAELVVVGTPPRRGALGAALGSTAELVVTAVACDVLLVPTVADSVETLKGRVRTATRRRRSFLSKKDGCRPR
jgi:nucleotide-binding universal stress UspA family protein